MFKKKTKFKTMEIVEIMKTIETIETCEETIQTMEILVLNIFFQSNSKISNINPRDILLRHSPRESAHRYYVQSKKYRPSNRLQIKFKKRKKKVFLA